MIVWSGKGFLSVLVLAVVVFGLSSILPKEEINYAYIAGLLVAGGFSWIMGKKWNESEGQTVIDKSSGQKITLKSNHSLFWIKMQYWGIIFGIIAIVLLVRLFI